MFPVTKKENSALCITTRLLLLPPHDSPSLLLSPIRKSHLGAVLCCRPTRQPSSSSWRFTDDTEEQRPGTCRPKRRLCDDSVLVAKRATALTLSLSLSSIPSIAYSFAIDVKEDKKPKNHVHTTRRAGEEEDADMMETHREYKVSASRQSAIERKCIAI